MQPSIAHQGTDRLLHRQQWSYGLRQGREYKSYKMGIEGIAQDPAFMFVSQIYPLLPKIISYADYNTTSRSFQSRGRIIYGLPNKAKSAAGKMSRNTNVPERRKKSETDTTVIAPPKTAGRQFVKAIPHNPCASDAQSDFSSECINLTQAG